MTDRPFRVIDGGGKPEPDEALVGCRKAAISSIETAAYFWVYTVDENGEAQVEFYGDDMRLSATVEELARAQKMDALGMFGDDE
jgi:hypothetical protein